jgi:ribosomal-protein-alanine N-acetyltransferase
MDARFRIRPATDADLPAIAEIERQCFPDPWSEDSFRSFLHGPARVVERDGTVVAYGFARSAIDSGEILNVAVASQHRREGIAGAIVADLCSALEAEGVTDVFLEVRLSNAPARALYGRLGFAPVGRRPRYYHAPVEDALILHRRVSRSTLDAEKS